MNKLTHCIRPRSAFQVIRFIDGPKLMLTCTKKGIISLHRLVSKAVPGKPGVAIERPERITDATEQREAIDRATRCGYNVIQLGIELRARVAS